MINWGATLKELNSGVVPFQSFEQLSSLYVFEYKAFGIILNFFYCSKILEKRYNFIIDYSLKVPRLKLPRYFMCTLTFQWNISRKTCIMCCRTTLFSLNEVCTFPLPGFPRKLRPKHRRKAFSQYRRHGQIRSVLSRHVPQFSMFESWNICAKMMEFKIFFLLCTNWM